MPDRIAGHYERHARAFDRARRAAFVEKPRLDRLLTGVARGGHVLDLGCGGGEPIARYVIDRGLRVTGVDSSETMVALVRARFGGHHWIHADMRRVALDATFDAVLAWDSLFHLPGDDQRDMIARIGGWLAPGGGTLFNTGSARGEAIGMFQGEEVYHASLDPEDYRAALDRAGIEVLAFTPEDSIAGGRAVWLGRKRD